MLSESYVSTTELAAILGLTARRVRQLAQDGIITSENGQLPLGGSVQRYISFISRNAVDVEDSKLDREKRSAEVEFKAARAQIEKLRAEEVRGNMHRAEDVKAMTEDLIYTIRSAIMALPGRLAVDVAAAGSPSEASEIIKSECYKVMRELSRYHYDPKAYEERVRERMNFDASIEAEDD